MPKMLNSGDPMDKNIKKSFIIYADYRAHFELFNSQQLQELIFILFDYHEKKDIKIKDPIIKMAFSFIKQNLDRDEDKWLNKALAGSKGGLAKASKTSKAKQKLAKASKTSKAKQKLAKASKASVNVNVNVNDNVNVTDNVKVKNKEKEKEQLLSKKIDITLFELFWDSYKKKGSRKKTLEQWEKLSDENKNKAIKSIKYYFAEQPEMRFRKDAERFLINETFIDVIERKESNININNDNDKKDFISKSNETTQQEHDRSMMEKGIKDLNEAIKNGH